MPEKQSDSDPRQHRNRISVELQVLYPTSECILFQPLAKLDPMATTMSTLASPLHTIPEAIKLKWSSDRSTQRGRMGSILPTWHRSSYPTASGAIQFPSPNPRLDSQRTNAMLLLSPTPPSQGSPGGFRNPSPRLNFHNLTSIQEFLFTVIRYGMNMRARSKTAPGNFGLNQVLTVNLAVEISSPEIAATSISDTLEILLVYCWNKESQIVEIISTLASTTYS